MTGVTPYTGQDAYGENGTVARRGDGDRFAVVVGGEHLMGYGILGYGATTARENASSALSTTALVLMR